MKHFEECSAYWLKHVASGHKRFKRDIRLVAMINADLGGPVGDVPAKTITMTTALRQDGYKPASINRRLSVAKAVLATAWRAGMIDQDLAPRIALLPVKDKRDVYLTHAEVGRLADACRVPEAAYLITFLAYTGLRTGEYFSLQARDVMDDAVVVRAENAKSGKRRVVPVIDFLRPVRIGRVTPSVFRRAFVQARAAVDMVHVRPHDLRHTYASLLVRAKTPLPIVRDLLGHANTSTTSRYIDTYQDDREKAVAAMAKGRAGSLAGVVP